MIPTSTHNCVSTGTEPIIGLDSRCATFASELAFPFPVRVIDINPDLLAPELPGHQIVAIITSGNLTIDSIVFQLPRLGLVALLGSGYDSIPIMQLAAMGIAVSHSPGKNANDVATHAVALFLGLNRHLLEGHARVIDGRWKDHRELKKFRSVAGLKIGIVGLGHVGLALAERMGSFGAKIAWWGPNPNERATLPRKGSLLKLAQWCDVLFLTARADRTNAGLIDRQIINSVGPKGLIVNVSRGTLIDEAELIMALRSGRLGGAGLDVYEHEPPPAEKWRDVPNLLLSPHAAAAGNLAGAAMVKQTARNVLCYLRGRRLLNPVPGSVARGRSLHELGSETGRVNDHPSTRWSKSALDMK